MLDKHPGAWCPDQYNNPDNVTAYSSLALELVAQLGRIDVLVCSVGTGGHSAGTVRVLREFFPHLRLVGVDTVGSTIFGQPARTRLMRGLGSSIYPRNVDYDAFDEVHWVAPGESVWACRRLAATHHASGGWSVGATALVAGWLARTNDADTRIAAVFPDAPHRYLDTVYNDKYCRKHGLLDVDPPVEPDTISSPSEHVVERWTRCAQVSVQGMFLIGGTLADRFGYKPLIVAGCVLRTGGFLLLGLVDSLPALMIASAATGFAGALFNPAVRAYLAADADERRVEAFALFNVFYQGGILLGPLVGLALTAVDFRLTCLASCSAICSPARCSTSRGTPECLRRRGQAWH